jgi:hypothetical protein
MRALIDVRAVRDQASGLLFYKAHTTFLEGFF